MSNRLCVGLVIIGLVTSCVKEDGINKFSDPTIVKIYDLKDRRLSDSLYHYFTSENLAYRVEAVLAFGSIQDSLAIDRIAQLLSDADPSVRKSAAFSLGQTPSSKSGKVVADAL